VRAVRHGAVWHAGRVSPPVCAPLVDRRRGGAVPSPPWLATAADTRSGPRSLAGRLSPVPRTHAAAMVAWVEGQRVGMHAGLGSASWDQRPLVPVLVGQGIRRPGAPDAGSAGDPRHVPPRGRRPFARTYGPSPPRIPHATCC